MWNVILQVCKTIDLRFIDPLHVIVWDLTPLSYILRPLLSSRTSQSLNPPFPILLWQVVWLSSDSFSSQAYFTSSLGVKYSSRCLTSSNITKHLLAEYPGRNNQATWIKGLNEQSELVEHEGQVSRGKQNISQWTSPLLLQFDLTNLRVWGIAQEHTQVDVFPLEFAEVSKGRKKREFGLQDSQSFKIERPRYKTCEPRSQCAFYLQIMLMS